MLKTLLVIVLTALPIICSAQDEPPYDQPPDQTKEAMAQSQMAAAIAAAGCGPSEFQFDVKSDNQQHPMRQADSGKALIYIFVDTSGPGATMRIGLDSKWMGATQDGAYFFFSTDPGEHRLCINAQSSKAAPPGTAGTLVLEAGRTYYFQVQVEGVVAPVQLVQLDDANGQYMVATHNLSIIRNPPKPQKHNDNS